MKPLAHVEGAIHAACHDASRLLSAHLRAEATASGWPSHVTRTMHVSYGAEGFDAHVHEAHLAQAQDLEYGRPGVQPMAAIRRAANRTHEAEKFLIGRLAQHLGEL